MNVTVYLPDEIGQKAKAAGLNLSRLLRDAIEDQLMNIEATEKLLQDESTEIELALIDKDGNEYIGTFEGRKIGSTGELDAYLKEDGSVLVYDTTQSEYVEFDGPGEPDLDEYFSGVRIDDREGFMSLMRLLGIKPKIQL